MSRFDKREINYEKSKQEMKRKQEEDKTIRENLLKEFNADRELREIRQVIFRPSVQTPQVIVVNDDSSVDNGVSTMIQIRKLDGSRLRFSMDDKMTISQVWDEIEARIEGVNRELYHLVQMYPRQIYKEEDMSSSLASLGLSPNGNLGFEKKDMEENAFRDRRVVFVGPSIFPGHLFEFEDESEMEIDDESDNESEE